MNKKDILNKIKSLDGLNQDERAYLVNLVNTKKKYGLVWEDKPEDVEEQLRTKLPVLQEVKERTIINDAITSSTSSRAESRGETPNHILIEGDNLHALTALTFTHENKIDLIYIDPPYNTGNKDFIYNDHYVDKEDAYRHSKWISFMEKRLRIAHKLLKDDGVIFISIDDNEQAQLKMLCDEVFLENNFITQFLWEKTSTPPALSKKVRKKMEYILCYEKKADNTSYSIGKVDGGDVPLLNSGNKLIQLKFPPNSMFFKIPDNKYIENNKRKVKLITDVLVENSYNKNEIILEGNFKWKQEMLNDEIEKGTYFLVKSDLFSIRFQRSEENLKTKTPTNRLDRETNVGTNEEAKKEVNNIGVDYFDYPKPISLLKLLINLKKKETATILDFFAGSGTTLHSLIELNGEDGGSRQGILVTNNENNIAEEVTYERNKRVIQGYTNAKGEQVEGLKNNNLRYYKTAYVDREPSLQNKRQLTQLATELLCIKEDCYTEVQHQLSINPKQAQIFTNNNGKYLVAIYHSRNQLQVQEQLISWVESLTNTTQKVRLYAFSPEKEVLAEEFYEVAEKVEVVPLPEAIYNAYLSTIKALKLDKKQVYNNHTAEA